MNEHGWSRRQVVPHGGHQMSLQMAAGLQLGGNESYPDVFQPYSGFADQTSVSNGKICLDDSPGIGFENNKSLFQVMKSIPIWWQLISSKAKTMDFKLFIDINIFEKKDWNYWPN